MFFITISVSNISWASGSDSNFNIDQYDEDIDGEADEATQKLMGTGIQVVRIVGVGISLVMLGHIGIKYMMAAPAEKADFKKSAAIYVLGAVLVFGATNILTIISETNFF